MSLVNNILSKEQVIAQIEKNKQLEKEEKTKSEMLIVEDNKTLAKIQSQYLQQVKRKSSKNGIIYVGGILNNQFEGQGIIYYKDKSSFKAIYRNGICNGPSKWIRKFPNESVVEVEYVNGFKEGLETRQMANGMIKLINYINNVPVGCYQETYPNGDIYLQNYTDGKLDINDKGVYIATDGTKYTGRKSNTNANMWKKIGECWKIMNNMLIKADSKNTGIIEIPIYFGMIVIGSSVAITSTAIGLCATPITYSIDKLKRYKNKQSS